MTDYERIAKVIAFIEENHCSQPSLEDLAANLGLSPFHFQKLFLRWAGVTPKKFLQCITVEEAKRQLRRGQSVLDASLNSGLSGPGRLHDLTLVFEAATPGEIKSGGLGWEISLGFASSPLGECMIAESPRGICRLDFIEQCNPTEAEQMLAKDWPQASIRWDHRRAKYLASEIFSLRGKQGKEQVDRPLRCLVKGTKFQVLVWRALLKIPSGQLTTYGDIARAIGKPNASRAVGTAIARNPIAYLIPCHRVIRQTGIIGDYRWGHIRKRAATAREIANGTPKHGS